MSVGLSQFFQRSSDLFRVGKVDRTYGARRFLGRNLRPTSTQMHEKAKNCGKRKLERWKTEICLEILMTRRNLRCDATIARVGGFGCVWLRKLSGRNKQNVHDGNMMHDEIEGCCVGVPPPVCVMMT